MAFTVHDITLDADLFRAAYPDWPHASQPEKPDLSMPPYPGPGIGITGTCGLCGQRFDLMAEPDQYPTLPNDMGEPEELICDACQDLMDAETELAPAQPHQGWRDHPEIPRFGADEYDG